MTSLDNRNINESLEDTDDFLFLFLMSSGVRALLVGSGLEEFLVT
jgi:hypothetical protein